jgi:hypothetical protein
MGEKKLPKSITKPKLLLVEGQDEVFIFTELLKTMNLDQNVDVREVGGKDQFPNKIHDLQSVSGYGLVKSLGILRDADDNPESAFQSVCSVLDKVKLPIPIAPLQPKIGPPQVTVMIIPDEHSKGMLETVYLETVRDDPAMTCVDEFFDCLKEKRDPLSENAIPKARVRAFLASREWLEIAHFEYLQRCMANYESDVPVSEAVAVPKVHAFLASRYTPDLSLGIAAQKSDDEDRYWNFNHPAFDKIKQFLQML